VIKRVRIVSEGTALSTRVLDVETGADLTPQLHVERVVIDVEDIVVRATLSTIAAPFDIVCDATVEKRALLTYDPDDVDSIDRAVVLLSMRRAELTAL